MTALATRPSSPATPPPAARTPGATSSRRFDPMLRGIVRGYRLDAADVEDVVQTTWIRAYRNLDRLNDPPPSAGGWRSPPAARRCARCSAAFGSCRRPSRSHADEAGGETPEDIA